MKIIFQIVVSNEKDTIIDSVKVMIPINDIDNSFTRLKYLLIKKFNIPSNYTIDFGVTNNYKFAKMNYIGARLRNEIISIIKEVKESGQDYSLDLIASKLHSEGRISKCHYNRLKEDEMLRKRILNNVNK
jgi:hypothetical protein